MHCPNCGSLIESEEIRFCQRCGQTLTRVRAAMSDEAMIVRGKEVSRAGLNLGVALMYAGMWPALLAVIASSSAIPIAFLMLSAALAAVILGSGPLLRIFQTEEVHQEVQRARRKEIAFGATLMYLGTIVATLVVAVAVPDWWIRIALIGAITAAFGGLMVGSKTLYQAYRDLASNEPLQLDAERTTRELETVPLDEKVIELRLEQGDEDSYVSSLTPQSVTEGTTRSLKNRQ